ncbi:MAG: hypothetical protein CMH56_06800 [Myxococcales bacterium]|nr:hypothetical protein [Myxococcales bacterium]|tara:strand:+ start:2997 stop:3545 length:549 start_codon:yes stop_codon:yes gene_type:complete
MMHFRWAVVVMAVSLGSGMACQKDAAKGKFEEPKKVTKTVVKEEAPPAPAAKATTTEEFQAALKYEASYDAAAGKVLIKANVAKGFHAYAPGDEISIPVSIKVGEDNGWKSVGEPTLPKGTKKDLGDLGVSFVLDGEFELSQAVKDGKGEIKGSFGAQICTDKACDRPRQHPFTVAVAAAAK